MIDGDPKILFDRRDELSGTLIEGRVNLVSPFRTSVGHEGVTRNRQKRHHVGGGIEVHDHVNIAIHPRRRGAVPELRFLNFQAAASSRSDQQNVHRRSTALEMANILSIE